jgi:hypothetical protein
MKLNPKRVFGNNVRRPTADPVGPLNFSDDGCFHASDAVDVTRQVKRNSTRHDGTTDRSVGSI